MSAGRYGQGGLRTSWGMTVVGRPFMAPRARAKVSPIAAIGLGERLVLGGCPPATGKRLPCSRKQ